MILLVACFSVHVQGLVKNFIDDKIYETIHQTLIEDYPNQKVKTDCLMEFYKEKNLADEFYTFNIIINPSKVRNTVQKVVEEAHFKCSLVQFANSLLGILISGALVIAIVCIICLLVKKVYQKCCRKTEYVAVKKVYYISNKI